MIKKRPYQPGDLVRFDITRQVGLVLEVKKSRDFHDNLQDVRVLWNDGEDFWCLEFTLQLVSKAEDE